MTNSSAFSFVLMILLIAMIYFMMIRPQKKKEKAEKEMRDALKVGDEVITIGGIIGKVEKINERTVIISTSAAKNKIEFLKTAIASVSSKDANAAAAGTAKNSAKEEPEEEKAPSRDKKVTPKKLSRKSDDAE